MNANQSSPLAVLISLDTHFDKTNVDGVRAKLNEAFENSVYRLIIDLTATEFIDENGLTLLVDTALEVKTRQGTLALVGARPRLHYMIEKRETRQLFRYFTEVESALLAVQARGLS